MTSRQILPRVRSALHRNLCAFTPGMNALPLAHNAVAPALVRHSYNEPMSQRLPQLDLTRARIFRE